MLLATGCTKKFEDINTDTNKVTEAMYNAEYSLTRAQLEYAGNSDYSYETWRVNIIYCGMMMQQLANTSWYAGDKYFQNDGWSSSYFEVAYRDQVKYVVDLLKISKDKPELTNFYHIGRIMKVMIFHRLTDIYGEIPYTEAGLGYHGRIFYPKYDPQDFIYADMLRELEEAATALDASREKPGKGDLIYRGANDNIIKWRKLAYSLMLRLGMRLVKNDPSHAKTWVEKAYRGGVFTSNNDNAYIMHDLTGGRATVNRNSNILGGEWNATGWDRGGNAKKDVFLSKTFIDFLKNNDDPRLTMISQLRLNGSTLAGLQVGMPNGYDQNGGVHDISTAPGFPGSIDNYSTIRGDVFLKLNGPTVFVSYAQCELLLAEAALRGWSVGVDAATHYQLGVAAAMKEPVQYDAGAAVSDGAVANYLAAHPFTTATGMEQINTQYWAACFLDWYETWANWRRSSFPKLVAVNYPGNATGGQIPRRMLYPSSEASVNATNYNVAIVRQGENSLMTKVWWDK